MSAIKLSHHLKPTATEITPKRGHTWSRWFFFFLKLRWRGLRRVIPRWLTSIPGGHKPRCQECLKQSILAGSASHWHRCPWWNAAFKRHRHFREGWAPMAARGIICISTDGESFYTSMHCGRMTPSLVPSTPVWNRLKSCVLQDPPETFWWRYLLFMSCYRYILLLTTSWVIDNVRECEDGSVIAIYLKAPWGCAGGSVWSVRSSCQRSSDCHVMPRNWACDGLNLLGVSHRQQSLMTPSPPLPSVKARKDSMSKYSSWNYSGIILEEVMES